MSWAQGDRRGTRPRGEVCYQFELIRLANTPRREGPTENVRVNLEPTDRLGSTYLRPFGVDNDLWAYPEGR